MNTTTARVGAECFAAALDYQARGWAAIPCCPPDHVGVGRNHGRECQSHGKAPLVRWKEFQDRLPTADEIAGWWRHWPNANVWVAMGPVSGLVGADVDGDQGEQFLREQFAGDVPDTLQFLTGGGRRLLFGIPAGFVPRITHQFGDKVHEGLTLLGKGSGTVMPPSLHKSGNRYDWLPGRGPGEIELAPMPDCLVEMMRPDAARERRKQDRPADGEPIKENGRNTYLFSQACSMRARGFTEGTIRSAIAEENENRCDPPLDNAEVNKLVESALRYEPGKGNGVGFHGGAAGRSEAKSEPGHAGARFTYGVVDLCPERPRQTDGGKVVVPVLVLRGGRRVDLVTVTNSASGRTTSAKMLAAHFAADDKNKGGAAVAEILGWALDQLATPAADDGLTVRQVVNTIVPDALGVAYRTDRGLYSATRGGEMARADFLSYTPSSLLEAAAGAADAPQDDIGLLRAVKAALEVLWADLLHRLKPPADVGGDTPAAKEFRAAVERLWHSCRTFEVAKGKGNEGDTASRVSLAGLVKGVKDLPQRGRPKWAEAKSSFSAWWRPWVKPDGEETTLLAMRWTLTEQIGIRIPGVIDQDTFRAAGVTFGAFDPAPPVSDRLSDGGRLAVLTDTLSARILATVMDDGPETGDQPPEQPSH